MNQPLSIQTKLVYAFGMMGWSILINLISVILVYFYLPPEGTGIPYYISNVAIFGIFNAIAIISAGGRLADAIVDPFIAQLSDSSKNEKGRRIPFMQKALLPAVFFCIMVFYPLSFASGLLNMIWLTFTLMGFYICSTTYIIPYNALLPELASTSDQKMSLSTWQSVGYVSGIAISSNAFNLAEVFRMSGYTASLALQLTVICLAILGGVFMAVPAFFINEKKLVTAVPHSVPLMTALKQTLQNKNFLVFIVADFTYFMAVTIITSGLVYFITVLLLLPETLGNKVMITMVIVSLCLYPIINLIVKHTGKKKVVIFSMVILAFIFLCVYNLGKFPFSSVTQIYSLIIIAAIPLAALNILPNAIMGEIISKDTLSTGINKEAMYFAVRYFFVKIAQTFGIALFAMLLLQGKDLQNDMGIRLSGVFGACLCLSAALYFTKFKENK